MTFRKVTQAFSAPRPMVESVIPNPKLKLLDQMREVMRLKHYSIRTERTYCDWVRRYIHFHQMRTREELLPAEPKIERFLSDLAVTGKVAVSTQNQAFNALLFVYRDVLHVQVGQIDSVRATRPARVPTVLTPDEARQIIVAMSGTPQLVVKLIYGAGLRLLEVLRLRIHDLDFEMKQVTVRDGKGAKDRFTVLPESAIPALREHLERVQMTHREDLGKGNGAVYLPGALDRKYPGAPRQWGWQYVFPARDLSTDPRSGVTRRHHLEEATVHRAIKLAVARAHREAGFEPYVPPQLCHCPLAARGGHPHDSGAARSRRRIDDDDLYARSEGGGKWDEKPPGLPVVPVAPSCPLRFLCGLRSGPPSVSSPKNNKLPQVHFGKGKLDFQWRVWRQIHPANCPVRDRLLPLP